MILYINDGLRVILILSQTAIEVGSTLAQRQYCRPDAGLALSQPVYLSGIWKTKKILCKRAGTHIEPAGGTH